MSVKLRKYQRFLAFTCCALKAAMACSFAVGGSGAGYPIHKLSLAPLPADQLSQARMAAMATKKKKKSKKAAKKN
jgi:hypothetical protein